MPLERIGGGFVHKRELKKIIKGEGYTLDFDATKVLGKLELEIARISEIGAKAISVRAKGILTQRAYETGALHNTIKVEPSRFEQQGIINKRARLTWLTRAGSDQVDYAMHVETGRYFSGGSRVAAVPFMRQALAMSRKLVRNLFLSRLKRILR